MPATYAGKPLGTRAELLCQAVPVEERCTWVITAKFFRDDLDAPAIYREVRRIVEVHGDAYTSIHAIGRPS